MLEPISEIDGLPLFKITQDLESSQDAAIKELFDAGYSMFYLLGSKKITGSWTDSKKKQHNWTDYRPTIFKVVKNFIGSGVAVFDGDIDELDHIPATARFELPPIPAVVIDKIDQFFRYVDKVKGTEAVVLFTYDPDYRDSDNPQGGWGFLVPVQNNTGGSCDYDPVSVMQEKPDNVRIVGTAHSHPQMAAFCSGTDKSDQMGFDGVHITYGWKGSGPTEFHCEVQMADYGFSTFRDEDIFEVPKGDTVDEDIINWTKEKVTKRQFGVHTIGQTSVVTADRNELSWDDPQRFPNLPPGSPSPRVVTLIWFHENKASDLENCPVCDVTLSDYTKKSQKCSNCSAYIIGADQDWESFKLMRKNLINASIIELDEETATRPIWMLDATLGVVEVFEGNPPIANLKFMPELNEDSEKDEKKDDLNRIVLSEWQCVICNIPNNGSEEVCWMCNGARADSGLAT